MTEQCEYVKPPEMYAFFNPRRGRYLVFQIGEANRVIWISSDCSLGGISKPFREYKQAEEFVNNEAKICGYTERKSLGFFEGKREHVVRGNVV